MPPLPEAIILVLAPFAPLFSHRVWLQAQLLILRAMQAQDVCPRWTDHHHGGLGLEQPLHFTLRHCTAAHHEAAFSGEIEENRIIRRHDHPSAVTGSHLVMALPRYFAALAASALMRERLSGFGKRAYV